MALSLSFKTFFICVWFKGPVYNHSLFVVQSLSCVWLFATPWTVAGFSVLHHLPEFTQTHVRWVSDAIQPSHSLLPLLLLPSIFPRIRVFSSESALCIRWPKCWTFSFSISPSIEYSGLISFGIDWFDLIAVQGTDVQRHSLKASILQC